MICFSLPWSLTRRTYILYFFFFFLLSTNWAPELLMAILKNMQSYFIAQLLFSTRMPDQQMGCALARCLWEGITLPISAPLRGHRSRCRQLTIRTHVPINYQDSSAEVLNCNLDKHAVIFDIGMVFK